MKSKLPPSAETTLSLLTFFAGGLFVIACGFILQTLSGILIPFFVALFLAYLAEPLQKLLIRFRFPTGLRVLLVLLSTALILYLVGQLVYNSVNALTANLPRYQMRIQGMLFDVADALSIPPSVIQEQLTEIQWADHINAGAIAQILGQGLGNFVEFLTNLFLVLLYLVYLLFERESFIRRLENSFSHRSGASRAVGVIHSINQQIASYLNIKTGISALTGIVVAGILLLFGVDFALFWGLVTFLLNFIPSFGSVLATIPPIIISFVQFETLAEPLVIMVLLISTQVFVGNVLEPKVMGDSLGMSPLIVVLALIFWGWLWGPVGMILSVPIISVFRITCENIDVLNPVGRFLNEPKLR